MTEKIKKPKISKKKLKKTLDLLKLHGDKLNAFLFGTSSSEMVDKGIKNLFPHEGEDVRQKTELTGRDVRACLYLNLIGKWKSESFGEVATEFMNLQISRGRMGRTELSNILMLGNLLEKIPKEQVSQLFFKSEQGASNIAEETKS